MRRSIRRTLAVVILAVPAMASNTGSPTDKRPIRFYDVQRQTAEFIAYNKYIGLTPEQQRIKTRALSSIPAPCCSKYSMATCCCPCNLAKSVWGLANHLIAEKRPLETGREDWFRAEAELRAERDGFGRS